MIKSSVSRLLFKMGQFTLLRRMFHSFYVKGIAANDYTAIIVNHSNFYDSLALFELQKKGILPKNTLAVMSKEGVENFPLFKSIGVLPISNPMKISEYKNILKSMRQCNVLIFPEGKENHLEKRPIQIEKGISSLLIKNPHHDLLFVSLYYSFTSNIRGTIACRMYAVPANKRPVEDMEGFIRKTMEEQLNLVKGDVIENDYDGYKNLWKH